VLGLLSLFSGALAPFAICAGVSSLRRIRRSGGIQDEYIAAIAVLAKRFKDDSGVIGYRPFNEPLPGWNLPPEFEDLLLFPFYRRVIDAITGVEDGLPCWTGFYLPSVCGYRDLGVHDLHHLFFLEAGLLREMTDFPTHLGLPVSSYDIDSGAFVLNESGHAGGADTVVYIPREVTGEVVISGGAEGRAIIVDSEGSRTVRASPSGGKFSIAISSSPFASRGCD